MGIRVGISGWRYGRWRETFYPKWLAQRRELEYASRVMNSVEINGSFYSLQRPQYYRDWYAQTPPGFVFAVKGSRFITHMKKLREIDTALANFFASGVLALEEKFGPILWQFPEQFPFNAERFETFLAMLPRDTEAAAELAKHHDHRVKGEPWTRTDRKRPIRHAFEVRHESYATDEFIKLLRRHNAAWVIADTAGKWPFCEEVTADFVYIRLHGASELYASGYHEPELQHWAKRVLAWHGGDDVTDARRCSKVKPRSRKQRDVYVYFDNDAKVFAPFNAIRLAALTGASPIVTGQQISLDPGAAATNTSDHRLARGRRSPHTFPATP